MLEQSRGDNIHRGIRWRTDKHPGRRLRLEDLVDGLDQCRGLAGAGGAEDDVGQRGTASGQHGSHGRLLLRVELALGQGKRLERCIARIEPDHRLHHCRLGDGGLEHQRGMDGGGLQSQQDEAKRPPRHVETDRVYGAADVALVEARVELELHLYNGISRRKEAILARASGRSFSQT